MKTLLYRCRSRLKLLVATILTVSSLSHAQADEFRGVWVDAWGSGFLNASEVTTLVNRCRTYNFNAVIVQMRRRGDAFYMPQAPNGDPRTTALASSYDALQELINQCHSGTPRIEVHCWIPTHLIWADSANPPSQAGHVYNSHPEYLMKNSSGATFMSEGYYLDPGHPSAAQWNYNVAKDIVSRYDIDGFHWDYIRYPQQDSGYNATAIARYNAEFGLTGNPSYTDSQFSTWRRRQVTDFLRWVNADLLALKPNLVISASVFASRSDAFNARLQDWAAWNNEGIIDLCFPMNYTADNSIFNSRTDDAYLNQGVRRVYMGPGAYLNTKENTVTQLTYARNKPLFGTSFYSYRTPNSGTVDQTGTFSYVEANYQPTWQNVPALPWKTSPTKGILKGTVTRADTGAVVYNATISITSSPTRTQKTEAHGKYAFFETVPATYTVSASAPGFSTVSRTATVTAGAVATLDLVFGSDTTGPVISSVGSSLITDSSARITWTTDESSDSTVNYGLTTSYGTTASVATLVTSHTVDLSGLNPSTTYNFQVRSKDAANNESVSGNFTFTTLAAGTAEIIIDNPSANVVGTWTTATGALDKYGSDYRYKSGGTGAAYLQYTPNITTAGNYEVYQWHAQGSNRTTNAPYVITHSGGTSTVRVNQQVNGGKWNLLGTFNFATGTAGYVRIQDNFADSTQVVMADAVRFLSVGATIPTAPSGLAATAISSSQINLSWTDNSSNEDNFVVARSTTSGGPYTDIATLAANTTSYNNTGLTQNTTYYYVVRASNSAGASSNSAQASATTAQSAPAAPSGLTATTISQTQINLAWTDNSSNEANFIVARSTTSGGPYTDIATLGANVTSYSNTGLAAGTTYYYVVRASNSGGSSANSAQASATTLPNPPTAPSGLTATAVSGSQIDLAWTDNSNNEANFIVARSTTSGGPYTDIATLGANVTSYSNTGLSTGVTYYYVVRASNSGGTSANSAQASATTSSTPAAPSSLAATAIRATRIDLSWNDNSGNEAGFIISRSTTSGGPYADVASVGANVTSFNNNSGLTANTTYYYVVRATNSAGASISSAEASATTYETDLLIDNRSATLVGTWTTASSSTDKYGTNYIFASQGTGGTYAQFTPYIVTAGSYQVYTWHPQGSNRTTNAPHVITYDGGSTTVYVNQKINGGTWNLLGTFPFASGRTGSIQITDAFPDGGQVVMADAIRLIYVAPPAAPSALTATAINHQRIDLTWADNSTDEDNFVIGRSTTSGGPYTDIAVVSANSTAYSDTGLTQNTTYYYVVRSRNLSGSSANSAQAVATTKRGVRVQSITMSWVLSGTKYKSRAAVTVTDVAGAAVASATVTGNFTGAYTNNGLSGTTTTSGVATITSTSSISRGTVTFSVTNIAGTNMHYAQGANVVTSATHSR